MQIQRTEGATRPTYKAWEERSNPKNLVRNPNGADNTVANLDDERWVARPDTTMGVEQVTFVDSYDDLTPNNALDAPGLSVMTSSGNMFLRFKPSGQVVRVADNGTDQTNDTLIRMRVRRKITNTRADQWDITLNQVGKVGSDYNRVAP